MDVKKSIEQIISDIVGYQVNVENDANLMYDYNMDSLQIMNVVVEIEDKLNIEFGLDELNVDDLIVFSKLLDTVNGLLSQIAE